MELKRLKFVLALFLSLLVIHTQIHIVGSFSDSSSTIGDLKPNNTAGVATSPQVVDLPDQRRQLRGGGGRSSGSRGGRSGAASSSGSRGGQSGGGSSGGGRSRGGSAGNMGGASVGRGGGGVPPAPVRILPGGRFTSDGYSHEYGVGNYLFVVVITCCLVLIH